MTKGRKPSPNAVRIAAGTRPNRINNREPARIKKRPPCPQWFSAEARKMFRRVVADLEEMRVLSKTDAASIELFSLVWARYREARNKIKAEGTMVEEQRKDYSITKINPWCAVANEAESKLISMCAEFGFTPSARSRLISESITGGDKVLNARDRNAK